MTNKITANQDESDKGKNIENVRNGFGKPTRKKPCCSQNKIIKFAFVLHNHQSYFIRLYTSK